MSGAIVRVRGFVWACVCLGGGAGGGGLAVVIFVGATRAGTQGLMGNKLKKLPEGLCD